MGFKRNTKLETIITLLAIYTRNILFAPCVFPRHKSMYFSVHKVLSYAHFLPEGQRTTLFNFLCILATSCISTGVNAFGLKHSGDLRVYIEISILCGKMCIILFWNITKTQKGQNGSTVKSFDSQLQDPWFNTFFACSACVCVGLFQFPPTSQKMSLWVNCP